MIEIQFRTVLFGKNFAMFRRSVAKKAALSRAILKRVIRTATSIRVDSVQSKSQKCEKSIKNARDNVFKSHTYKHTHANTKSHNFFASETFVLWMVVVFLLIYIK